MSPNLIKAGGVYHDNKSGVREVLSLEGAPLQVTYRILAAKVEQSYEYTANAPVSIIGTSSICGLASFAQWAKTEVPAEGVAELLASLAARRLKLPPGEKAFMAAAANALESKGRAPVVGERVSVEPKDSRSAKSVEAKGLATFTPASAPGTGGTLTLTLLGACWIRAQKKA